MARSYYRVFFVLKEDTHGYGAEGRAPQGRCVVEARGGTGKVTVYVQDLKPMTPYKAALVKRGEDRSHAVSLGGIEVNASRRCETCFEINPDNVGGLGYPIEDYDIAAIICNDGRLHIPLSDSRGSDGRWKNNLQLDSSFSHKEPEESVQDSVIIPFPEAVLEEPAEPSAAEDIKVAAAAVTETDIEVPARRDYDDNTREAQQTGEDPHDTFKGIVHQLNKELSELAEITASDDTDMNPVYTETDDMESSPFDDDSTVWRQITLQDLSLFPVNLFDYEQKAVITEAYHRYGPLIISDVPGVDREISVSAQGLDALRQARESNVMGRYVLGIPGVFTPEYSRGYRQLGFNTFRTRKGISATGAEGYWLKEL